MKDDSELERQAYVFANTIVDEKYSAAVKSLVKRNLARAKAMRGMKRDLEDARAERDLWKSRFEKLRKRIASAAQPETWL